MAGVTEEVGKQVSGIVSVMGTQPLSLALVIMNLVLLGYMFYMGSSTNNQRKETVELIVNWQKESEKILASCVSAEVTRMMLDNMQKITDTMLQAEQKEINRMQGAITEERNRSYELREREKKELDELKRRQQQPESAQPRAQNLSSSVNVPQLPPGEPIEHLDVPLLPLPPLPPLPGEYGPNRAN